MIDGDLVDLRCHVRGESRDEVSTHYKEGGGDRLHAVWLYFPVQDDERVFEIWRRRKKPHSCRDIPIVRFEMIKTLARILTNVIATDE